MAIDSKDWQELYEGAREVHGPTWAAIFMKAIEPGLRDDLATKGDLAELRADFAELRADLGGEIAAVRVEIADLRAYMEAQLRAQTWRFTALTTAAIGVATTVARIA